MPVIFVIYLVYKLNIQGEDIKCDVIFFSIILQRKLLSESYLMVNEVFLSIIQTLLVFFCSYDSHSKSNSSMTSPRFVKESYCLGLNNIGNRNYSTTFKKKSCTPLAGGTNRVSRGSENKLVTRRKTLTSPKSRAYEDLYAGRGIPKNEPVWVKDNGRERSPFGASWAKDEKDRLALLSIYPCNYVNISDPYNNRELIKESCKGNRVVYIWTYLPTGVCLVGSSSNSVERVLSYFEKKYLFLDTFAPLCGASSSLCRAYGRPGTRRGVQFLADYGFKNIQLTIIYFAYNKFTTRDIKINEAYYINELNSSLNSQKYVYLPPEPLVRKLQKNTKKDKIIKKKIT